MGGFEVTSSDSDPMLRYGLDRLAHGHVVADARRLPFDSGSFDAIATEPPYDKKTAGLMASALREMDRVISLSGRLAILCALWQADSLRRRAVELDMELLLDAQINRKGLDVVVLLWAK